MKEIIFTENAPAPIGPYSQGILTEGKILFVSGQIPLTPDGALAGDDIVSQTHQALKNVLAIVEKSGGTAQNIVKTTVLMKDLSDFAIMNEIYEQYLGNSNPARAAYQVARLPKDVLIEIEAIAVI